MVWDGSKLGVSDPTMALGDRDTRIISRTAGTTGASRPGVGAEVTSLYQRKFDSVQSLSETQLQVFPLVGL